MSVCVSAILSHNWPTFSQKIVEEIAHTVSHGRTAVKWVNPDFKSPEEEFSIDKTVQLFLPNNFTLKFGEKIICLGHTDRWSQFLTDKESLKLFLSASRSVADMAGSKEILFLPEGSELMNLYYGGAGFENCKRKAIQVWRPPDLEIGHNYTAEQIDQMTRNRVHYGLMKVESVTGSF